MLDNAQQHTFVEQISTHNATAKQTTLPPFAKQIATIATNGHRRNGCFGKSICKQHERCKKTQHKVGCAPKSLPSHTLGCVQIFTATNTLFKTNKKGKHAKSTFALFPFSSIFSTSFGGLAHAVETPCLCLKHAFYLHNVERAMRTNGTFSHTGWQFCLETVQERKAVAGRICRSNGVARTVVEVAIE